MAAPDFQETCPRHNPVNPGAAAAVSAAAICQKVNATCPITYSDIGRMSRVPSGMSGRLDVVRTAGQDRPSGHIRQHFSY